MLIGMHEISRQLRETCIADNSHHEKSRTTFCLVAQSLQSQRELCGIHNRHEERDSQHSI